MTDAATDEKQMKHPPRGRNSRRRAAAARHSRAYRERQKAMGVPTGSEIDAMIARILIKNIARPQGLKMDREQMPKLCQRVAEGFAMSDELLADFESRVAIRIERLRAAV